MRICIIVPELGRPTETFIRSHIERLLGEVSVVSGGARPRLDNRMLVSTSLVGRAWRRIWSKLARDSGYDAATRAYIRVFRKTNPDVVLAEYGPVGVWVREACRRTGVPLVVCFRGADATARDFLDGIGKEYPKVFGEAAAIVAVSHSIRKALVALGCPEDKIFYNPSGVDVERFSGASPARAGPIFLSVGRFVPKKAPHLALAAFARVHEQISAVRLRMIGTGPLLDTCRDLALGLRVEHAVHFLGMRTHEEVLDEMRRARCLIQHSIRAANGDTEGTPNAIMEASACGLPVVATRHSGICDAVIEGESGFLVDEHDVTAMARHMLRLARDPQLAEQLGSAGRQRMVEEFDLQSRIARVEHILQAAVCGDMSTVARD